MARISADLKQQYRQRSEVYRARIKELQQRETTMVREIASSSDGKEYSSIAHAGLILDIVSYCVVLNSLSMTQMRIKNEPYLNIARKGCYRALISLESVVTNGVDVPFSDYKDKLDKIVGMDDPDRFFLIRKLGYSIQAVVDGFGDNTKWKWSFVEIWGRYATIAKNIIDFRRFLPGMSSDDPDHELRVSQMEMTLDLLKSAADRFRQKYELLTLRMDDFKIAISYLVAVRYIYNILNENEKVVEIQKQIDVWKAKMEADYRKISDSIDGARRSP